MRFETVSYEARSVRRRLRSVLACLAEGGEADWAAAAGFLQRDER